VVDKLSLEYVKGATVDFTVEMIGETFEVRRLSSRQMPWIRRTDRDLLQAAHELALTAATGCVCPGQGQSKFRRRVRVWGVVHPHVMQSRRGVSGMTDSCTAATTSGMFREQLGAPL
jgi:hypothetical protein